jgi:four helix bundle protein
LQAKQGSLYELIDHLSICMDEGYIDNTQFTEYRDDCIRGIKLINGYIRSLSKQKKEY